MVWIDNMGPSNELVSVSAGTTKASGSGTYYYCKDFNHSTGDSGIWYAPSLYKRTYNFKGLQFEFSVTMAGTSMVLGNSIFQ